MRHALVVLLLLGCGGGGGTDIQGTLVFADRSDLEIVRLINAAAGTEVFGAEAQLNRFGDTFDSDPCPSVTVSGNVATVTGGCTTGDGVAIEGTLTVTNPLGWDQIDDYDFGSPTVYEARAFSVTYSGQQPQIFDGTIRRSDSFTVLDADITVTQLGVALRSDLYYHCTNPSSPACTVSGSGIELVGVGGALVSGSVSIDRAAGRQTSQFTLQGVDRLTVIQDGSCVGWSIEGTDRGITCP